TEARLGRLNLFTAHLRRTMARIQAARSGREPLTLSQLGLLEDHIVTSIMPLSSPSGLGEGSTSRDSSISSGMAGLGGTEAGGAEAEEEDDGNVGLELSDAAFGILADDVPLAGGTSVSDGERFDDQHDLRVAENAMGIGGRWDANEDGRGDCATAASPFSPQPYRRDPCDFLGQLEAEGVFAASDSYSPCGTGDGNAGGGSCIPSALSQPREVNYQCGECGKSYSASVSGNPWWALVRQECPECHKTQIPRIDILNPTNNVDGHVSFLTEYGTDGDGSCCDWDGETSDDNSDDDFSGDE
ncbi:unnamed protein product, partial [Sphacelaria rigidula]